MNQPNTHAGEKRTRSDQQTAAAILLAEADGLRRQARSGLGKDQRDEKGIYGIKAGKHQPRDEGALIHVADRLAELVGHHDQHQRGRDDLRQRAGGGDDAGRHPPVVAVAQHDRQRDQAHRDHGSRHHAGGRRQQRADEHDGVGEAAADGAEQLPDGVEQVLGHAGSLQHQSHEGEERDREQRVVVHHAVDAFGKRLQEVRAEFSKLNADDGKDQADRAQRECRRIAEQQHDHQRREHNRRHVCDKKSSHQIPLRSRPTISVFRSPRRGVRPRPRWRAPAMRVDPE